MFVNDKYKDFVKLSSSYNHRLVQDRKLRTPFLDSQTGVAQEHSHLWMQEKDRQPPRNSGQVFSYPARRWRKRKRAYLLDDNYLRTRSLGMASASSTSSTAILNASMNHEQFNHSINASTQSIHNTLNSNNSQQHHPQQPYFNNNNNSSNHDKMIDSSGNNNVHNVNGISHEISNHNHTDMSFMHDSSSNSNACSWNINEQSKDTSQSSKADPDGSTSEGTIVHGDLDDSLSENNNNHSTPTQQNHHQVTEQTTPTSATPKKKRERKQKVDKNDISKPFKCELCGQSYKTRPGLTYHSKHCHAQLNNINHSINTSTPSIHNAHCDFCLGDAKENKKTMKPEELVSCDCGRSGHPSCLNWTPNILLSVKKYKWQCIECKSCGLCGTSDHDDQLLFCDDCDRGYHMYCLKPPMEKPPEGLWSCALCLEEYYKKD